jgi:hypothetical protein
MEHGWAFWWIIPVAMFFWWGPRRRGGRGCADRSERAEVNEETRARLAALEQLETRVSELENRLDFTERLLAQRTSPAYSGSLSAEVPGQTRYE